MDAGIYYIQCILCLRKGSFKNHGYVGQTARKFSQRLGEHRRNYEGCYGKVLDNNETSDEYALRMHVQKCHNESLELPMAEIFKVSFLQGLGGIHDIHVAEDRWASRLIPGINKQTMVTKLYK